MWMGDSVVVPERMWDIPASAKLAQVPQAEWGPLLPSETERAHVLFKKEPVWWNDLFIFVHFHIYEFAVQAGTMVLYIEGRGNCFIELEQYNDTEWVKQLQSW